ncbi:4'-phosphopantetheinyl transferase family protein [Vibrio parahaemolyticus]|uniref:4'-phosphopantetheinyl transferase family protein n=2 Tax=Vibrio parahaemolyticus TaxID=670 RepID=UPI001E409F33|nr:4'-phosphopantetheinyl transferase superfamily protein [Vibrio parahaemolyticus]
MRMLLSVRESLKNGLEMFAVHRAPVVYQQKHIEDLLDSGLVLGNELKSATVKRKAEFLTGRHCAKTCYNLLGVHSPIQPSIGEFKEPIWMQGYAGSISHCDSMAVAVVTQNDKQSVGIDIEKWLDANQSNRIKKVVCSAKELRLSSYFSSESQFVTIAFSAKESLYKALYPSLKRFLNFNCCEILSVNLESNYMLIVLTDELSYQMTRGRVFRVNYSLNSINVETLAIIDS